jgi:hypothetical protein
MSDLSRKGDRVTLISRDDREHEMNLLAARQLKHDMAHIVLREQ